MSDEVRRALRERKKESMTYRMYAGMYRDRPHPPTAALAGDYDTLVGLAGVCRELDIPTDLMICAHSLKDVEEPMEGITHFPESGTRSTPCGRWITTWFWPTMCRCTCVMKPTWGGACPFLWCTGLRSPVICP